MRQKKVTIFLLINLKNPNQIKERQRKEILAHVLPEGNFHHLFLPSSFLTHHSRLIADFSFRFSFLMN
jgi:hypothetical protein